MARNDRKTATREAARARKAAGEAASATGHAAAALFRDRWQAAVQALSAAETQVGRQVQGLMKEKHLTGKDASVALRDLRKRLEKERKKAGKGLEVKLGQLQARVLKEGQALRKSSEDAVQRALGAINVPSRQEIGRLTRKVEELTRKVDRMRPGRRR
jgi:poly(hydroxyalkanoate) granule associated protein phasin